MMKHFSTEDEIGMQAKSLIVMEYVLGPTPVKSRRSITSACCEPFLGRDLPPLALGFSWMASSEVDLRPVGLGATAG